MSHLNDQFQGGIDPLQNHRDLGFLETRQTRYAARVVDYDQSYRPIVDPDSVGDMLCASHWGPSSRAVGGWAHAWPVTGGSPVNKSNFSSTGKIAEQVNQAIKGANAQFRGRGGKNADGTSNVSYLQIGIGLAPGGFDTLGGTGRPRTFDLPNGYFFGIDAQFAGLGGDYRLVIYDGPTVSYPTTGSGNYYPKGKGGHAPAGQRKGAAGPLGPAGAAGANAFAPGGAFGGSNRVVTGDGSGAGGSIAVQPIKNSMYARDKSFGAGQVNTPAGWPSLVDGSVGIVLGGTEHTKQEPVYIHGDPRMVAVNNGADPAASSVVYDTDSQGRFDDYRKAKLHSAWRVLPPFSGLPSFGPGGTLAWQLATGERDSVAGLGAVIDTSSDRWRFARTSIGTRATTSPGYAPTQFRAETASQIIKKSGNFLAAAYNAGMVNNTNEWLKRQSQQYVSTQKGAAANPGARERLATDTPALTVGLTSASSGGFIEVGHGTKDKHVLGVSGDHKINAAHISTDALFYRDQEDDAPLEFEEDDYDGAESFPLKAKVHLQYDPNSNHAASIRTIAASGGASNGTRKFKGKWRWWAEVPNTKEGGGETPPPVITPGSDPPPTVPVPPAASDILKRVTLGGWSVLGLSGGQPGFGTKGGGGGSPGGTGAGSYDMPTEFPAGKILASAVNRGRGSIYQQVDQAQPFVRVPGLLFDRVAGTGLTVPILPQSRLDVVRERSGAEGRTDQMTGFPAATAHTVLLFRPQHTHRSFRDLRTAISAPEAEIRQQMADRPITLRAEAFGREDGLSFRRTQARTGSRFEGGTGNGGVVYLPPELDLLDIERTTHVPSASTSYVVAHPGVWWASGYARKGSGDVKTGYRWGGSSAGALSWDQMDSSGTATTVMSLSSTKVASFAKGHALAGVVSPSQITSNQNNYAPTGWASANVLRVYSDISRDVTGISSTGIADGQTISLVNIGSADIVLKNASGSSLAANQFSIGADYTLAGGAGVTIWRDATTSTWRTL